MISFNFHSYFVNEDGDDNPRRFTSVTIYKDGKVIAEGSAMQSKKDEDVKVLGQLEAVKRAIRNNIPRSDIELRREVWDEFYGNYSRESLRIGLGYLLSLNE